MSNFEVFTGKNKRTTGYSLTIDKRGLLSLSRDAYTDLGEPQTVHLLYDRESRLIGLRPAAPDNEDAYAVRSGRSIHVSGSAFLRYYRIPLPVGQAQRRTAAIRDGILQVEVDQEPTLVTSNRAAPGRAKSEGGDDRAGNDE